MKMGIKPLDLPVPTFTDLMYTLFIDDITSVMSSRHEARQAVDESLNKADLPTTVKSMNGPRKTATEILGNLHGTSADAEEPKPLEPDEIAEMRKTWGLLPEHQAGLRRATGAVGAQEATTP